MGNGRRSSRIALSIPVEISGLDASGAEFEERASTKVVSRHGACIAVNHRLLVSSEIKLKIPSAGRIQSCRVAWVSTDSTPYETGIELEEAENFWGVQFPPEDWVAPENVPLAGDQPARYAPHSISGDDHEQIVTVGMMLNALIGVLKEKGVVTQAELAMMLKKLQ